MRLLIIRTSAMGDVALLAPVLRSMEMQYPDNEMILVTRPVFAPFFYSFSGVKLFLVDFNKRHNGLTGIFRLRSDLNKEGKFDFVIDLHDVMRSRILRGLFSISGVPVKSIRKGRKEKRYVLTGKSKVLLKHSAERYYDVFATAGFPLKKAEGPWIIASTDAQKRAAVLLKEKELIQIGVAPYAKHDLKMWPESSMIRLMEMIARHTKVRFWLFGGKEETPQLLDLQNRIPESVLVAGTLSLDEELALISGLKFMISMDSSNMHMAALSGTKVISIWGGTDPLTGFGAWQQPDEFAIRIPVEELTCRPCTVYGKGKCRRDDLACMNWLTPEMVFDKLINLKIL
ncbi:MAG: glycosyltransferase family 9 protein [Bacteroidia bacterium]|nr:glycosyltransferase family 9 protein [Bacteroidia bacterium]